MNVTSEKMVRTSNIFWLFNTFRCLLPYKAVYIVIPTSSQLPKWGPQTSQVRDVFLKPNKLTFNRRNTQYFLTYSNTFQLVLHYSTLSSSSYLMFIGPCIIVIVEEWKTNLMSFAILFHFLCAQHVSDINISIITSLRLFCWITTLVVLFWFDVCWSFGVVGLEWYPCCRMRWTAVAQWLMCCATNRKVAGSIAAGVSGFFIDIKFFRSHYGPGVDSPFNRNEYQEHFLGVKAAGA